jgi:hypothetical protein
VGLKRGDYRLEGKRARLRLLEKGNKEKLVWLHREAEELLDAYLAAAGIDDAVAVARLPAQVIRLGGNQPSSSAMLIS